MKALILKSGQGTRMGDITINQPKCMTHIYNGDSILSRQLKQLKDIEVNDVVITTGYYHEKIQKYCKNLNLGLNIEFVKNEKYAETNYIYSIYKAMEYIKDDDIILMHGDLVFENEVLSKVVESTKSVMTISSTKPLPEKDFKAVIKEKVEDDLEKKLDITERKILKVGVEFFNHAYYAQPLYKLLKEDAKVWLEKIKEYCESGEKEKINCYAEKAFNEISEKCNIYPYDIRDRLCAEIDDPNDLIIVSNKVEEVENRTVYMCFSADILHGGHMKIIKKASKLGKLIVGVLSDEAIMSYKRFPIIPFEERKLMFENLASVYKVVKQNRLSYKENIRALKPDYVVHGDEWKDNFQKTIRNEVIECLSEYGGKVVEFPYSREPRFAAVEKNMNRIVATPERRRGLLKNELEIKNFVTAMEAHDGLTGLVVENTKIHEDGGTHQFDAMWVSSLCDSTARGKPDIELVDLSSRLRTINDLMEVTTKPIIFDGDTGGKTEHFVYAVRTLERVGVSMIIIEDKVGLKKNSLFGTEVKQTQDTIENFCKKIEAGKHAQKTEEFMICARIESLILEQGMEDALKRAEAFVKAGADAIMIHSRKKEPDEIFEFVKKFREKDKKTYIVVVPTSFNSVYESEFKERGVNIVIYANQLMRATVPAIQKTAESILKNHRSIECDQNLMSFKEIIRLIPEEE